MISLNTMTEDEFIEIISKQKEDYVNNRDLWDDRVIAHLLKLGDYTKKEFEGWFDFKLPIDNFDDEEL